MVSIRVLNAMNAAALAMLMLLFISVHNPSPQKVCRSSGARCQLSASSVIYAMPQSVSASTSVVRDKCHARRSFCNALAFSRIPTLFCDGAALSMHATLSACRPLA